MTAEFEVGIVVAVVVTDGMKRPEKTGADNSSVPGSMSAVLAAETAVAVKPSPFHWSLTMRPTTVKVGFASYSMPACKAVAETAPDRRIDCSEMRWSGNSYSLSRMPASSGVAALTVGVAAVDTDQVTRLETHGNCNSLFANRMHAAFEGASEAALAVAPRVDPFHWKPTMTMIAAPATDRLVHFVNGRAGSARRCRSGQTRKTEVEGCKMSKAETRCSRNQT